MTYLQVFPRRILGTTTHRIDSNWTPKVDIREGKDTYTIEFDLPGSEKSDFNTWNVLTGSFTGHSDYLITLMGIQ